MSAREMRLTEFRSEPLRLPHRNDMLKLQKSATSGHSGLGLQKSALKLGLQDYSIF